jgi:hypothetical protein
MYGFLYDCLQNYFLFQYGQVPLETILRKADATNIAKNGWVINQRYPDDIFVRLVKIAAAEYDTLVDELLENVGLFFIDYCR